MRALRSVAFNILFYLNLVLHIIVALPTFVLPRAVFMTLARSWGRTSNALLAVVGIRVEYRGLDKIPPGAMLVAAKHQSVWETFAILTVADDPAYIFKRELMWIQLFGWYLWKSGMVPVDRRARGGAMPGMIARARDELAHGRQIVIFPEGTRTAPGAPPRTEAGSPISMWRPTRRACPSRSTRVCSGRAANSSTTPGTIVLELLDPIPPGLDREAFAARVQQDIEAATARLIAEGERELRA